MKIVIAGSIAIVLGLFGFSVFFPSFLTFLAGTIPLLLIIGGGLTIYLNYDNYSSDCKNSQDCQDNSHNKSSDHTCNSNVSLPVNSKENKSSDISSEKIDLDDSKPEKQIINESINSDNQLVGNTESHVFHNLDCKFSKSKNCTALFNSKEKAIQEGYKPCGICKP